MTRLILLLMILLAAGSALAEDGCSRIESNGSRYVVCRFDPAVFAIRLHEYDGSGKPYGAFAPLAADLAGRSTYLRFAMNGGMYKDDRSPVGLYIENGRQLSPLNTNTGWGNFHLLPNGVFYLMSGKAGVMESRAFAASGLKPSFATQSGPMLVIDGKLHPSFLPDSDSLKIRNGVGVSKDGHVVFALSEDPVRFYDFAVLFRDALGCGNALFLDGTISSIYVPEWQRQDDFFPMGPIISVTEPILQPSAPSETIEPVEAP